MIITQVILVAFHCLQRKPISLFQTQASGNPSLFHSFYNTGGASVVLKGERRGEEWRRHDKGREDGGKETVCHLDPLYPKKTITPNNKTNKYK